MNFKTLSILIFSIILVSSCTRRIPLSTLENLEESRIGIKEEVPPKDSITVKIPPTEIKEIEPPKKPKRFIVSYIEKSKGIGKSKVYNFSLNNDGLAFYKGSEGIRPLGQYYANIPKEKVMELLVFIDNNNMKSYATQYPISGKPVSGIPLTQISIATKPDNEVTIKNYHHAPKALVQLEKMIEEIIEDTKWTPTYE